MLEIRKDFVQAPQPFNTSMEATPTLEDQKPSPRFEGRLQQPQIDTEVVFRSMSSMHADDGFTVVQQSDLDNLSLQEQVFT